LVGLSLPALLGWPGLALRVWPGQLPVSTRSPPASMLALAAGQRSKSESGSREDLHSSACPTEGRRRPPGRVQVSMAARLLVQQTHSTNRRVWRPEVQGQARTPGEGTEPTLAGGRQQPRIQRGGDSAAGFASATPSLTFSQGPGHQGDLAPPGPPNWWGNR
jgi:hypothetical protein